MGYDHKGHAMVHHIFLQFLRSASSFRGVVLGSEAISYGNLEELFHFYIH